MWNTPFEAAKITNCTWAPHPTTVQTEAHHGSRWRLGRRWFRFKFIKVKRFYNRIWVNFIIRVRKMGRMITFSQWLIYRLISEHSWDHGNLGMNGRWWQDLICRSCYRRCNIGELINPIFSNLSEHSQALLGLWFLNFPLWVGHSNLAKFGEG